MIVVWLWVCGCRVLRWGYFAYARLRVFCGIAVVCWFDVLDVFVSCGLGWWVAWLPC